jgi:hypothetical protein
MGGSKMKNWNRGGAEKISQGADPAMEPVLPLIYLCATAVPPSERTA